MTERTELLFTPLVSAYRRKLDRMHFMRADEEGAPWEQSTFCGLSASPLDSGCLSTEMDFEEVQEQVDVCKRCMAHIRALSNDRTEKK